jgi:hypothetical protein
LKKRFPEGFSTEKSINREEWFYDKCWYMWVW